jgi:mono/diheme cytochrome c family protein
MGGCSQPRSTVQAPDEFYNLRSPIKRSGENIKAGMGLFQKAAKPVACAKCHGYKGDGLGPMANMFSPPPRDFTCAEVVKGIPEGQLFWIIKNGSDGTSMPAFDQLDDNQIWQLVAYINELAK